MGIEPILVDWIPKLKSNRSQEKPTIQHLTWFFLKVGYPNSNRL